MDWEAWGARAQEILTTSAPEGAFRTLFAPGAEFSDPVNGPDYRRRRHRGDDPRQVYPDWRQEIVAVHGDDEGGAFEWIGRGTLGGTTPTVLHGCTMLEIDDAGPGGALARLLRLEGDRGRDRLSMFAARPRNCPGAVPLAREGGARQGNLTGLSRVAPRTIGARCRPGRHTRLEPGRTSRNRARRTGSGAPTSRSTEP